MIAYGDSVSTRAALSEGGSAIGHCASADTAELGLLAPAAAVVRCVGHFPESSTDRATTLVFALPDFSDAPCQNCNGTRYEGSYAG